MKIRLDSRGEPINRGLLGDKDTFISQVDKLGKTKKDYVTKRSRQFSQVQ